MSDKQASPFAGMKLSEPAGHPGPDQRLFAPPVSHRSFPRHLQALPGNLPRKEPSQEPRKVETQEPGRQAIINSTTPESSEGGERFDIGASATEKNSYMFSQEELWALKDVEAELERTYRTDVPKYNIVRLGLHMLLEDYFLHKSDSFLVRKLHLHSP